MNELLRIYSVCILYVTHIYIMQWSVGNKSLFAIHYRIYNLLKV